MCILKLNLLILTKFKLDLMKFYLKNNVMFRDPGIEEIKTKIVN